jgi:hypothetical protein
MTMGRVVLAVPIAAIGLAACAGDDGGDDQASAGAETSTQQTSTSAAVVGGPVLIETRVTDARHHHGEVVDGSVIGEVPFCPGGTTSGSSEGATITTTFDCPEGTLQLQYAPTQPSLVQGADWLVLSGTGALAGLHGGGSMAAVFSDDDPDAGREVFTGNVIK